MVHPAGASAVVTCSFLMIPSSHAVFTNAAFANIDAQIMNLIALTSWSTRSFWILTESVLVNFELRHLYRVEPRGSCTA